MTLPSRIHAAAFLPPVPRQAFPSPGPLAGMRETIPARKAQGCQVHCLHWTLVD